MSYIINGNTLVFTDQHFGIKGNSPLRQKIGAMVIKNILETCKEEDVSNIIFCGDYFHQRNALTVDTLNIAHRCLCALAKDHQVYMVLGNHDLFNKSSVDVNSISIFKDIKNVHVVDTVVEASINGRKALLVPWLSDLSKFNKDSYDMLFGHFDISAKFLISNYEQLHSKAHVASKEVADEIDNEFSAVDDEVKSSNEVCSIVDLVKTGGTVFAGHIHSHKEMAIAGKKFIFVGSPYEQNLGEMGCECGVYVIDSKSNYKFIKFDSIPKHVQFRCSEILEKGIDNYDFSTAHGNIVQKVYDVDIGINDDVNISKKIASYNPYEELLPDYQVAVDFTSSNSSDEDKALVASLNKSKLDYIKSYIDQLDDELVSKERIEKKKLLALMSKYYNDVAGE